MDVHALEHLQAVERSPEVLSGAWRFRGTRVPVAALFENLRDGATVADFLAWFPGVTKAQVDEVLDFERQFFQQRAVCGRHEGRTRSPSRVRIETVARRRPPRRARVAPGPQAG